MTALDRSARTTAWVLVLGGLMAVLDITIVNVAIGRLASELHTTLPVVQWVSTAYTLALATVVATVPWLVARLGGRRVYVLALSVFLVGSVLAGFAWDIGTLIAARAIQGLGGGLIMPTGMTIALQAVGPAQRGRMMSMLGIPVLIGPVVGPTLGGWILDALSWRWIFFINVPLGAVAVAAAALLLPRDVTGDARRLDLGGLVVLSAGLVLFVLGIAGVGEHNTVLTWPVLVPLAVAVVLVTAFVIRSWRRTDPAIDVRLLVRRDLGIGTATVALYAAAYFGSMFLIPLYYQTVRGISAAGSGALIIPQALATGITMQIATRRTDRMPARRIVRGGIVISAIGFGLMALALGAIAPLWVPALIGVVVGVGVGSTMLPAMTAATRQLQGRQIASGSTLWNIVSQVSVSIGTALTSVALTAAVRANVSSVGSHGIAALYGLSDSARDAVAHPLGGAFRLTLMVTLILIAGSLLVSLRLPREADEVRTPAESRSEESRDHEQEMAAADLT